MNDQEEFLAAAGSQLGMDLEADCYFKNRVFTFCVEYLINFRQTSFEYWVREAQSISSIYTIITFAAFCEVFFIIGRLVLNIRKMQKRAKDIADLSKQSDDDED
jgi:hypothetical protein